MDVPATPRFVATELGLALIVKSGAAPTLYVTIALCDNEPLVPVTVTVKEPDAVDDAEHESVLVPEFPSVTLVGESVHVVVPEAPPVTVAVNETGPLNPFKLDTVIVEVPAVPALALTGVGLVLIIKSGAAPTLYVTVAECEREPLEPVT